jgi:hypothetical protein
VGAGYFYVRPQAVNDLDPARTLLPRFLAEEATPHVRRLLLASIAEAAADSKIERREFNFNAIDVEIDFREKRIVVADALTPETEFKLSLADFVRALGL